MGCVNYQPGNQCPEKACITPNSTCQVTRTGLLGHPPLLNHLPEPLGLVLVVHHGVGLHPGGDATVPTTLLALSPKVAGADLEHKNMTFQAPQFWSGP